jgi:hypothetical protein
VNRKAITNLGDHLVNEETKLNAANRVYGQGSALCRGRGVAHTQSHTKGGRRFNAARKGITYKSQHKSTTESNWKNWQQRQVCSDREHRLFPHMACNVGHL